MAEVLKQVGTLVAGASPSVLIALVALAGFTVVGLALWVVLRALSARGGRW